MSEVHDDSDRPQQYRTECPECGRPASDQLRMHSHLQTRHLQLLGWDEGEIEGVSSKTMVQCNQCGNVKEFPG
ncbi:hypothetical protein [Halomarina rubra]|uniref:Small CPxCG-related zinc finger protein n=1 Tax=Halomarina rubra TaxID=2071873 RepID=A0ABD6AS08_9EURY|nr:hypothetical protein [Halomarina rubra]